MAHSGSLPAVNRRILKLQLTVQVVFRDEIGCPAFPDPLVPIPTKENETRPCLEERRRRMRSMQQAHAPPWSGTGREAGEQLGIFTFTTQSDSSLGEIWSGEGATRPALDATSKLGTRCGACHPLHRPPPSRSRLTIIISGRV